VGALDVAVVIDLDAPRRPRQRKDLGQQLQQLALGRTLGKLRASASRALASAWSTRSFFSPRWGTLTSTLWPLLVVQASASSARSSNSWEMKTARGHGLSS